MAARGTGFLGSAVLTVVALVLAFALGEIVVRLLYRDSTVLFPRYQTDYRYGAYAIRGIRPNSEYWMTSGDGSWKYVTNDRGFRDARNFAYAKPPGVFRVLSVGDSHTQGYEVRQESTFSAVLERALGRKRAAVEVLNTGVSGFGNAEELVFLENEGIKYSPDVVVLGFFANDFEDNFKAGLFGLDGERRLAEQKHEHLPGVRIQNVIYAIPGVPWLSENSYFYSLLFNTVWNFFKLRLGHVAAKQAGAADAPAATAFEYAVPTAVGLSDEQVALAAALVERMHRFCAERGIRFIVVDVPVYEGRFRALSSLYPAFRERLQAARVEFLSSDAMLQGFNGVAELHVTGGTHHISEFTHALIGAELGRRILAEP